MRGKGMKKCEGERDKLLLGEITLPRIPDNDWLIKLLSSELKNGSTTYVT